MYQGKYQAPNSSVKKKKKRITSGTVIFYLLYFLAIAAFSVGMRYALTMLNDWLVRYEASQPDNKSAQIFDQYFSDPDWAQIYTMTEQQDTLFETKEAYAAYMEQKVGDAELTYSKTSAGLTGGQKYIVKLDGEKVATFTLSNSVESELEIPQWELNTIEIFYTRNEHVTIQVQQGCTVSINGIPLDDSYIISATSTVAEDYLPEGIHGTRTMTLYADGLLYPPAVTVTDSDGNPVEMVYDEASRLYTQTAPKKAQISDLEYQTILDGTKAYCRKMIGASSSWTKYFDKSSEIYSFITRNELWFKGYTRYDFGQEEITEYCRYSDNLVSARIKIALNVYRSNGSVKVFNVDNTLFLRKTNNGNWLITEMTSVDIQEVLTQVRLTYMQDNAVIHTEMVPADTATLSLPQVTVPEGKVFSGWFRETTDDTGAKKWTLVFAPSDTGTASLPSGYVLEPMVLHALMENKGA